jgi:hydrophobic/amphiphilic exporter-1 (mainly G- bacteria), HAE1 family
MSITRYAVRRPVSTVAVMLAVLLLGAVSLHRLPVTLLPDVDLPVLTIRTRWPAAAAPEVSRFVAEPVEEAVAATPGLLEVRTVSRNGEATTTLRFAWGTEMEKTVLDVRERLDNARSRLPERAERPTLLTSDPGERPIAVLAVTGDGALQTLARTAEDVHARRLEQLTGVASVAVVGAPEEEIRIEADPDRLRQLGLTATDVSTAVRLANASSAGGTIRRGQFRFAVRAMTELRTLDEIADTPVGPASRQVRLRDVATVRHTIADPVTMTRLDGRPAVGLVVYKDAGANTVAVTREIEKTVEQLAGQFPGMRLTMVAAQARFVSAALNNLVQEIVVGGALALIVILFFLRDLRAALAIGVVVPLSITLALVVLQFFGVSLNVLSLGGLALGIGMLVDNAIVVTEAAGRVQERGDGAAEAAIAAGEEVAGPLTAGTLTTLLVFGPIVFVQGLAAALFRDLSLSVVASVGASLVLALTILPVILAGRRGRPKTVRIERPAGLVRRRLEAFGGAFAEWYERGMEWCLHRPGTVIAIALVSIAATGWVISRLPTEILPSVDEGTVVAELRLPEGTAIEETARQAARIEAAAAALGARGIYARVGAATDEEVLAGANVGSGATAQLLIPVPDGADASEFADGLRTAVPDLAQGALALDLAGQSEFGSLVGREGRLVRVEISGNTPESAAEFAERVRAQLGELPTLADVRNAYAGTQPIVEVELERERLARYGIAADQVIGALGGALGGVTSTELRETDRRTPITVRFAGASDENLAAALGAPVSGVPVDELVRVRETRAPVEVVRVGQRPVAVVEALVASGGTARAAGDVRATLGRMALPGGVSWALSGADEERRRTTDELTLVAVLAVALVFLVLAGEFGSFTTPLVVMTTVPLAAAGGFVFLWMTGQSINAVALIGIVVMIGVADNDAVVKIDAIRRFREQGHSLHDAIILGGRRRLRPIVMTSLTTIAGVLPLVLGLGSGGALYQPLAAGVIGGSVSALLVTFFLLPTVYGWVEGRREARLARQVVAEEAAA